MATLETILPPLRFPLGGRVLIIAVGLLLGLVIAAAAPSRALAACANPIACENALPGDPESDWQPGVPDDQSIEGFATSMSVNAGQTVSFKIKTVSKAYHIDILRIGYYGGDGARIVAGNIKPSVTLPQAQPACMTDASTGLIDCGNWSVSASWAVPSSAVSGVYVAHLVRDDAKPILGESSHIVFVVRNDASHSDFAVQTSDQTWMAYNQYGGNSLYTCEATCPAGNPGGYKGAYAVSYNRPFWIDPTSSFGKDETRVFWAEYPLIRFLEANGYDVSYLSGSDVDRSASLLLNHKVFISSGHDEYWSGAQRSNVVAARNAGVSLAFFSGNEMFWKTRWQPSIDGSNTPYRTLVTYKETHFNSPVDPQDPTTWTGTWRDPRFSPPADGGRPENAVTGQFSMVDAGTADITVPATYGKLRFWRNTAVAGLTAGQTLTLAPGAGTLGDEWDVDSDNGFRPSGLFDMSSTTVSGVNAFTADYGTRETVTTTLTHNLTLYRAASGALVFGAGTMQWAWGLDADNNAGTPADPNMQQATVNLFADMGVQPTTLDPSLVLATRSTDTSPPTSSISSPTAGATVNDGNVVTVTGTASDQGGGVVAGVEISTDGGSSWHPANLTAPASQTVTWTYSWTAHGYPHTTVETRAVDDSGNLEIPSDAMSLNVTCPCSLWGPNVAPSTPDSGDASSVEVGVKFTTDTSLAITGLRFYKAAANGGTHVGSLWTSTGQRLAQATFTNETASGWQQVNFASPIAIAPGTTYVASYFAPKGHYAGTPGYFYPPPSPPGFGGGTVDSGPLHALRNTGSTTNGVFAYSTSSTFPTSTFGAGNYWVDPVYATLTPPNQVTNVTATPGYKGATVSWSPPAGGGPAATYTITPYISSSPQTPTTVSAPAASATVTGLAPGTYTFTVQASNAAGAGAVSAPSSAVSVAVLDSLFDFATPPGIDSGDTSGVELGVKFTTDTEGSITGIRFYKAATNTGTHVGSLWTSTGQLLATATFVNESSSGWQQVTFSAPVYVTPGTMYVAGYFAPSGHYSYAQGAFNSAVDNPPLHAVANGTSVNGVYAYSSTSTFPPNSYLASNYWVDVMFAPPSPPSQVTNVSAAPLINGATVSWSAPTSGPVDSYTITPYVGSTAQAPTTVSAPATSAAVTGLTPGTSYTFTVQASNSAGSGPASPQSNAATALSPTAPSAPTNVLANPASNQALVSWTAPSANGKPITGYTVTPYMGSIAQTPVQVSTGSATSTALTGLTNGTAYTFTVTATNSVGNGPASTPSAAVTPEDTIFDFSGTPSAIDSGDGNAVELGVKFMADTDGSITGIRFYKGAANTGTHVGSLWTLGGQLLAQATFTTEAATGWQQVNFSTPITITAGTLYVAGYYAPKGHYSSSSGGLGSAIDNPPLHAISNSVSANGLFVYGPTSTFPTNSYQGANYWVDVLFAPAAVPGSVSNVTAATGAQPGAASVSWSAPGTGGPATSYTITPYIGSTAQAPTSVFGSPAPTSTTVTGLTAGTSYTFTVQATNSAGSGPVSAHSNAVVPGATAPSAPQNVTASPATSQALVSWVAPSSNGSAITGYTITPRVGSTAQTPVSVPNSSATSAIVTGLTNGTAYTFTVTATNSVGTSPASSASPAVTPENTIFDFSAPAAANIDGGDGSSVELGVKFTSDVNGSIVGIRFYKAAANTGTHIGAVWTIGGQQLAQATFTTETASGWQIVTFATPVAVTAGTTYVASYFAPAGHYSGTGGGLASAVDNSPLHAVGNNVSADGLYAYSPTSVFPTNTFNAANYWVDVLFKTP